MGLLTHRLEELELRPGGGVFVYVGDAEAVVSRANEAWVGKAKVVASRGADVEGVRA